MKKTLRGDRTAAETHYIAKRLTAGEQTEYTHTGKKQLPTTKRKE